MVLYNTVREDSNYTYPYSSSDPLQYARQLTARQECKIYGLAVTVRGHFQLRQQISVIELIRSRVVSLSHPVNNHEQRHFKIVHSILTTD